jgi:hypothetical protein
VDGIRPNLVCCTVGGKVFVHSPHEGTLEGNLGNQYIITFSVSIHRVKFLNINKNISAITAGSYELKDEKDILVVASQNAIIAYGKMRT